jgi:hypothetical protein
VDSVGTGGYTGDLRGFQLMRGVTAVTLERNLLSGSSHSSALISEGGQSCVFRDNVWAAGNYGVMASGQAPGTSSLNYGCGTSYVWSGITMIGSANGNIYPAGTTWVGSESQASLAAQLRSVVQQATAGVK